MKNTSVHVFCLILLQLATVWTFQDFVRSSSRRHNDVLSHWHIDTQRGVDRQADDHESEGQTRREFLSWGPATMSTVAMLEIDDPSRASAAVAGPDAGTEYRRHSNPRYNPQVPFSSARRYRTITLSNDLRVLLVSDKRAFRASAALSVGGAGQFADPDDLPGLAHLTEHMILSYNSRSTFRKSRDFEEWLSDREGASNAFTAYDTVCFHFSCPESTFPEALERFATLFVEQDVEEVSQNTEKLQREIRRVNSELDFEDSATQAYYLTKDFVNPEHPYSRFSAGNLDSLERFPKEADTNVSDRLIAFFRRNYQPKKAVLVAISSQDLSALETWVAPFSDTLSRTKIPDKERQNQQSYPGGFLQGNRLKHMVLYRKQGDLDTEKLSLQWALNLDYGDAMENSKQTVTATQIGFVLSRILGRRGPGGLYRFLLRRGWVPSGVSGIPRVVLPVEVSRFQIIKLDITLTTVGFNNRSAVITAIYDSIAAFRQGASFSLSRQLVAQYATVAKLHGYVLAPRPPDSVELAVDAQLYGLSQGKVGSGEWYRFPDSEDRFAIAALQKSLAATLLLMSDPENAVIIATAGSNLVSGSRRGIFSDAVPPLSSSKWLSEPTTGSLFYFDDMLKLTARVEELVLTRLVDAEELSKAVINPLVPTVLRPPRLLPRAFVSVNANENSIFRTENQLGDDDSRALRIRSASRTLKTDWVVLEPVPGQMGLPLPRSPPEPTCRCAFVLQLLSPRPARANVREAARAELWRLSFENAVADLAELGAPGALAYDLSFNKYGLRISVLGISQTLSSYTRRLSRRLIEHHLELLKGPEIFPSSITDTAVSSASKITGMSQQRKRRIISNLRRSTAYEAATEGILFLRSCTGAVCFAEGDLLRKEVDELLVDLKEIFASSIGPGRRTATATPEIDDILYKPVWKPRSASPCSISGVPLVADACGRIPR